MKQRFSFLARCLTLMFAFTATSVIFAQDYSALEWRNNGKMSKQQVKKPATQTVASDSENSADTQDRQLVRLRFFCNDAFLNNFDVDFKSIGKTKDLEGLAFSNEQSVINLNGNDLDVRCASFDYPVSSLPANIHVETYISANEEEEEEFTNGENPTFVVTAQLISANQEPAGEEIIEVFFTNDIKIWRTFDGDTKLNK